ncbi:MAG: hypothetical protein ACI3Z8_08780 [Paludibacteraceae bacterium]
MFYKNLSADLVTLFSQLAVFAFRRLIIRQTRKWIMSKYSMEETQWKKLNGRKTQSFAFQPSVTATTRQRDGNDTCLHREKTVTK